MISAMAFEFPNGTMYCAGEANAVKCIQNYFQLWDQVYKQNIDMTKFVERIIINRVYGLLESKTIREKVLGVLAGYNRQLNRHGLLMTEIEYIEALVLTYPEVCCERLGLSQKDFEFIKRESIWNTRIEME